MLPDLIEIKPLEKPVKAEITMPGSKSITNRALILAALANGTTTLQGALWSEDTQAMVDCLQKLGFEIKVASDENEFCNRTITVQGLGGKIPNAGTPQQPLELLVGNAGTAARFLSAFVCLGNGFYRLSGVPRMHERPQGALFKALRELGYQIESSSDKLPATIHGIGSKTGSCTVSIEESSQFASALLLCADMGRWKVTVQGENAEESPYVAMTSKLIEAFPRQGGVFRIEPDASSGSYFIGAHWLLGKFDLIKAVDNALSFADVQLNDMLSDIHVRLWPNTQWQIDEAFIKLTTINNIVPGHGPITHQDIERYFNPPPLISRLTDMGDSIMTLIALSPLLLSNTSVIFTDLGRLRDQECERVYALRTELTECGAKVEEVGDTLTVYPSKLHGAEIETYNDHRMAMCFAILGLKVPGIRIKNPACVKKTFPNFFQKLAAAPPAGLGAVIVDARTQKVLSGDELFAE